MLDTLVKEDKQKMKMYHYFSGHLWFKEKSHNLVAKGASRELHNNNNIIMSDSNLESPAGSSLRRFSLVIRNIEHLNDKDELVRKTYGSIIVIYYYLLSIRTKS